MGADQILAVLHQVAVTVFALFERCGGPLALGDVAEVGHDTSHGRIGEPVRGGGFQPAPRTAIAPDAELDDAASGRIPRDAGKERPGRREILGVDELVPPVPHQSPGLVSADLLHARARVGEGPVFPEDDGPFERVLHQRAKTPFALLDSALRPLTLGDLLAQAGGQPFRLLLGAVPLRHVLGEAPQLEERHRMPAQDEKGRLLVGTQAPHPAVHHAQRAQRVPVGGDERSPRVEAHVRIGGHERVVGETGIQGRIGDHEQIGPEDGVGAESRVARDLGAAPADHRLEPLPVFVHQPDEGDRRLADAGRHGREVVERVLPRCVEDSGLVQCSEALELVPGYGRLHGGSTAIVAPQHQRGFKQPLLVDSRSSNGSPMGATRVPVIPR